MDLDLKQWEHHHHHHQQQQQQDQVDDESEDKQEHTTAKLPKLPLPPPHPLLNTNIITRNNNDNNSKDHPPPLPSSSSAGSTLPLFVADHPSPPTKTHPFPRMWSYFSMAQWQELELQALIYRYMLFGAAVPPELLHSIKKSLFHQPSSLSHHQPHLESFLHYPQSQPFRFQAGYWGSASTDPEPGRCRRTDGKKWRCSRDVVPGHKYCERHVHRGRNRSRKPVEMPPTPLNRAAASPTSGSVAVVDSGYLKSNTNSVTVAATGVSSFAFSGTSGHSPFDLFQMSRSQSGPIPEFRARNDSSRCQFLRHFLDDCPRPLQEHEFVPSTGLSMSTARNSSSDVSLKLSTGDNEQSGDVYGDSQRAGTQGSNWSAEWSPNRVVSMGGPLAEALRSSVTTNHSLPTSVLSRLTRGLTTETSLITQSLV